ncbi:hypothetical protein Trydic_g3269 [Trypoxylus dichotomus]
MVVIPMRVVFTVLGFFGIMFTFALKANLGIAIVSMVNHTAIAIRRNQSKESSNITEFLVIALSDDVVEPTVKDGAFIWSSQLQGVIVSSYFWGYLIGQVPGGRLAEELSAKWAFYGGVSCHIIGTLLTPLAVYLHFCLAITVRVIEGVAGGFTFPSMHFLLTKWAPPHERATMTSCIYTGAPIGIVTSLLLTGTIAHYVNWETSFYILGGIGLPWMALWPILVSDSPLNNKLIREKELRYLRAALNLTSDKRTMTVPWKAIFSNAIVWILIISHVSLAWGWNISLTQLPLYMNMVLKFKMDENGAVTALPFFCMFLFSIGWGKVTDLLTKKGKLSVTNIRKLSTVFSAGMPVICCTMIPLFTNRILDSCKCTWISHPILQAH